MFVGAMDTAVSKVMEKIALIGDAKIDGVVLTTPFYNTPKPDQVVNWFTSIADRSPFPIFLYDLAVVTKFKVTPSIIDRIIRHPNIGGIKTADWELIHYIERTYPDAGFQCLYSGLDSFDYANMMAPPRTAEKCTTALRKTTLSAHASIWTTSFLCAIPCWRRTA